MQTKRPARRPPKVMLAIRLDPDILAVVRKMALADCRSPSATGGMLILEALRARRIAGVKVERKNANDFS